MIGQFDGAQENGVSPERLYSLSRLAYDEPTFGGNRIFLSRL
jgi:hypothetical protein